jgi:hypothetical protein
VSVKGSTGQLNFPVLRDRTPVLKSGDYDFVITATVANDSEVVRLKANVAADDIGFVPVPEGVDESKLLPEVASPIGAKALAFGIVLGGATAALANGLRADDPVKSAYGSDSRALGVAAGVAVGAALAMVLDHGRPLTENAEANRQLRANLDKSVADAKAENARRIANYTVTIKLAR